jgi:oxygen-dependent protoporphyrinogen oxidase
MHKRVCVIGGGISGLCTAFGIQRQGDDVTLFEKGGAVGGNIRSERRDGFLIEHGPNSLLVSTELLDLISKLGISDHIAQANPAAKKRFIIRGGKLTALPAGLIDLVRCNAFSAQARLRLLKEPFVRTISADHETVSEFFERRLGREIVDYAVDPFISGIFAGDPERLSVKHAFPRIFELERGHGSLLAGALFSRNGAKRPKGITRTISFTEGMQTLTDSLSDRLGASVRLNTAVRSIVKDGNGFSVELDDDSTQSFDAVVISTPARAAAGLLEQIDPDVSSSLSDIYYPPIAVVHMGFANSGLTVSPDGFGFLVPKLEGIRILGSLWTSSVFDGRSPAGHSLFTTFIGGARNAEFALKEPDELIEIALAELDKIHGLTTKPTVVNVTKWERAIPQYNVGYEKVMDAVSGLQERNRGIFICSNFYKGISVGDCIKNGIATTREIEDFLTND